MGDHMKLKKILTFIILIAASIFFLSLKFESIASIDRSPDIYIQIIGSSNSDIHVELMVLKTDFNEDQIYDTISLNYRQHYPNYLDYSHLEDGDEVSYLAYIDGAYLDRSDNEITYTNYQGFEYQVTHIRLVMFTSEGEILAKSDLYEHSNYGSSNTWYIYKADFDNYTFIQQEEQFDLSTIFTFLALVTIFFSVIIITLIGGTLWIIKMMLSSLLEVKYKYPEKTIIFDILYIISGSIIIFIFHYKYLDQSLLNTIYLSSFIVFIWNVINFFILIKKENRKKYLFVAIILHIVIGLIVWFSLR